MRRYKSLWRLRPAGGAAAVFAAIFVVVCACGARASALQEKNSHAEALAALSGIAAAIGKLDAASKLTDARSGPYRDMALKAIADLAGTNSIDAQSKRGKNSDPGGALGSLDDILNHSAKPAWKPAISSARVNVTVARSLLREAASANGLDAFQSKLTDAMEALLVAKGSPSETGATGGISGALSTTELGVPEKARTVNGCAVPNSAPAYGVIDGYLTFVSIPAKGSTRLPEWIAAKDVAVGNGVVVIHTAASNKISSLCAAKKDAADAPGDPKQQKHADASPHLFTKAQAVKGQQIFRTKCVACHGKQLQGKSGPQIAGEKFLKKAQTLNWSVGDLRNLVVQTMPRNDPGSLSSKQYSQVLAYLLSANCFQAGDQEFPARETSTLDNTPLKIQKDTNRHKGKDGKCLSALSASN